MSSSHKYFSGVQYCKNKMSWMCSKTFKGKMDSVTRVCAYNLCKHARLPWYGESLECPRYPEEAYGEWKRRAFSQRSVSNTAEKKWKTAWKSGEMISREIGRLFLFNNNARSQDYFPKRISETNIVLSKFTRILFTKSELKGCLKNLVQLKNVCQWSSGQQDGVNKQRIISCLQRMLIRLSIKWWHRV